MIHRLVLERLLDGGLDESVRGCVDIGSGFVQHHHFTVLEQCATDADELTLTYRQVVSTFSHLEVQTCSPTTKTVGHVHLLEDVPDALVRVLVERVEVFTEGSTEEHGVLWDDGEATSLMVAMSTSSMSTRPLSKSQIRKSAIMRDDFPAPVRPQIPTFSPAATSKLTPLSTSGSSGWYRRHSWSKRMVPLAGHIVEQEEFLVSSWIVLPLSFSVSIPRKPHDPLNDRRQHKGVHCDREDDDHRHDVEARCQPTTSTPIAQENTPVPVYHLVIPRGEDVLHFECSNSGETR
ncbi:hypothetical protein P3T76_009273 [Phytophthora citrophthora]|uniref:Uncharacterized protein n=1 Tax=Phytophthora citrophthora TaxID=4793 RepID=A0AAD9LIM5_9STRA|nr:hypothetical protein P3T76_009273 [Phytophthora citrophthora]